MKQVYPIILTPDAEGYVVSIPDFDGIGTEGDSMAEAIYMARDAIGLTGIDYQDDGRPLPPPSAMRSVEATAPTGSIVTLVDVDFDEYRRRHDNRAVRKNLTIPSWLNEEAEAAGVNFSAVLQDALKEELRINDRR